MNPFELAQQKRIEEEARKAAEKNSRPKIEKKVNPFEANMKKKQEEEEAFKADNVRSFRSQTTVKQPNAFELAQKKKQEEE